MMYWILLVMGAVISVVTAVLVGGALVPRQYRVERSATLRAGVPEVHDALRAAAEWPVWMTLARSPRVVADSSGTPVRIEILDDTGQQEASLSVQVTALAGGTAVQITEAGEVANPVTRLLRHYVTGHTRNADAVLQALAEAAHDGAAAVT